jgi:hypothetical protein
MKPVPSAGNHIANIKKNTTGSRGKTSKYFGIYNRKIGEKPSVNKEEC